MYASEVAEEICKRIATGESLNEICKAEGMPCADTVTAWAVDDIEGFFGKYTRAKQMRCFHYADEIIEIADDSTRDYRTVKQGGRDVEVPDKEHIQRSTLRVDTRKWLMVKYLPRVFGDKIDLNHSGGVSIYERIQSARAKEGEQK